jgi:hypothetical protein
MNKMITQTFSLDLIHYARVDVYAIARRSHCVSVKENSLMRAREFTFLGCTNFPMSLGGAMNADFCGDKDGEWWFTSRRSE